MVSKLTTSALVLSIVTLVWATPISGQERFIFRDDLEEAPGGMTYLPEGVVIDAVETDAPEGNAALRIRYDGAGPVSVTLHQAPLPDIDDAQLQYRAAIRGEDMTARGYLEMWVTVNGGRYFSRDLPGAVIETTEWELRSTPFFLKKGEVATRAELGVRFEGPGTLWIDKLELAHVGSMAVQDPWANYWWLGGLMGMIGAVWGTLGGVLIPRGIGRRFMMGFTIAAFGACLAMALFVLVRLRMEASYEAWYPFLISGLLGCAIFGWGLWFVPHRYGQVEASRMRSLDASEGI